MEKDPVCGMSVDPKTATIKSVYQSKTYYFCSAGCRKSFEQDPGKYVAKPQEAPKSESHGHH
jgi:Cu+-exporting ATPase